MQVFKEQNYLDQEDFAKFLDSFDGISQNNYKAKPELLKICASIEYYCALRISEVLTLKRDDFDLRNRILTLQNTKTGFRKCKCSKWEKRVLISSDTKCSKCKGLGKYRVKQYTTIPKPLIIILSDFLKSLRYNKNLFSFSRISAWKYYKIAGKNANLEIREQQFERSIEGVWTHLLRKSYLKWMRKNGASIELCEVKARHSEKRSIDHYIRPDIQALKIWEAKQFG